MRKSKAEKLIYFEFFFKFVYFLFTWFSLHEALNSAVGCLSLVLRNLEDSHSDPYIEYSDRYYIVISLTFAKNIPRYYLETGPR